MSKLLLLQIIPLLIVIGCGKSFKTTRVHQVPNRTQAAESTGEFETSRPDIETGLQLYRRGDFDSAAAFFQLHIFSNPASWQGYYYLGLIHNQTGRFTSAVEYFHRSLDKLKSDKTLRSLIYTGIGESYRLSGKIGQARLSYHSALNLDPSCKEARDGLALLHVSSGP